MTLDDLLENFIEKCAKATNSFPPTEFYRAAIIANASSFARNLDEIAHKENLDDYADQLPTWHAAKLYLIARDEGIEAAMLWKLAN